MQSRQNTDRRRSLYQPGRSSKDKSSIAIPAYAQPQEITVKKHDYEGAGGGIETVAHPRAVVMKKKLCSR